jgi:hypothetical protein
MTLDEGIFDYLTSHSGLAALIGTRLHPDYFSEDEEWLGTGTAGTGTDDANLLICVGCAVLKSKTATYSQKKINPNFDYKRNIPAPHETLWL